MYDNTGVLGTLGTILEATLQFVTVQRSWTSPPCVPPLLHSLNFATPLKHSLFLLIASKNVGAKKGATKLGGWWAIETFPALETQAFSS